MHIYYAFMLPDMLCESTTHPEPTAPSVGAAAGAEPQASPWHRGRWRAESAAIKSPGLLVKISFRTGLILLRPLAPFFPD